MSLELLHSLLSNAWSIFLVVLFFGGSIFVHELGHFLVARRRGVHVERFSIGFGPAIFKWRGKDGVEYRLSWIPLGGYVLLPQLADLGPIEGRSEADVEALPPIGYTSKMLVFVAGAAFNILFAFALAIIVWLVGQPATSETVTTSVGRVVPTLTLPDGSVVPSPASEAGLQVGDVIRAIDGAQVDNWGDIQVLIGLGSGQSADGQRQAVFTIDRDGRTLTLAVHPRLVGKDGYRQVGIAPGYELIVQRVTPDSAAAQAGFVAGDQILSLDGVNTLNVGTYFEQLDRSRDRAVTARVQRGEAGQEQTVSLTIPARADATSGADIGLALSTGFKLIHPTPFAQLSEQFSMTFRTLWSLINPHSDVGLSKVSGPVGIVRIFHSAAEAGIRMVLVFTILINVNLAIFNLLPLPILDGGQMLFATIGKLCGRALPPNFIIAAQSTFGVLLLTLVIYVSFFDVRHWVRDAADDRAAAPPSSAPAAPAK